MLDRNRIRYIDPDAFAGLPRLRELRMEENGLRSLAGLAPLAPSLQVRRSTGAPERMRAVHADRPPLLRLLHGIALKPCPCEGVVIVPNGAAVVH